MTITLSHEDRAEIARAIAAELAVLMQASQKPDRLLSCADAAKQLGIHRETVRQLILAGHIARVPGIKEIRIASRRWTPMSARRKIEPLARRPPVMGIPMTLAR